VLARSVVVVRLIKSHGVVRVDGEVGGVDVVSLHDPLKDLWLVDGALLHEVYGLVLYDDCMVNIVVELNLKLILQLPSFVKELLILNWLGKVFIILSKQVELTDMCP
jgi:hypothetical protein